ncbi:MAG: hypothetical protein GY845_21475 [Planctomycetes bacterium]|nr:hypothetical protein [Planctomycetota bacterium]
MRTFNPGKCSSGKSQEHVNHKIDENFRLMAMALKDINNFLGGLKLPGTSRSTTIGGSTGGGGGGHYSLPPQAGNAGKVLKTDGSIERWEYASLNFFGYNETGEEAVDIDGEDLTITTEVTNDSPFTHTANSAEVTINDTAEYEIIIEAGFNFNEGTVIELSLYRDDGGGYDLVECATAHCGL